MSQILNSLVISDGPQAQRELESIMYDNIEDYVLAFTTYPLSGLGRIDRDPDIIFIESEEGRTPGGIISVIARFPRKTYVVLGEATTEERREYLNQGIDEVMSFGQLRSSVGQHLLEKLLALKELAAAEMRIEQSEERFRGIIEHSHDVIMLLDEEATVIYTSPAFGRQLWYDAWDVLGQSFFSLVHEEDRAGVERDLVRLMAAWSDDGMSLKYRFRRRDGAWRDFETVATNLLRTDTVRAVVLNSRDVTELRRTESALEKERELVEQQRTFISMVSHEFRTPLTIIDGNAQIIQKRGNLLEKDVMEKRTGAIRASVDRLVHLIETILSAHAIESGKLALKPELCSLEKIIREVCAEQQEISHHHSISTEIQGLPAEMRLDPKIVRQMLTNLVSNAVKYSPKNPEVLVAAGVEGGQAVIRVKDRGIGIPESELPKISQKYFRASTAGGIPGSGLGLNLVKQFVELHEGALSLQSKVGEGTVVTVRLPISAPLSV